MLRVVVHSQIDGLVLAQGEHIQQGQIPPQDEDQPRQQHQGEDDDLGVDVFKVRHQGGEQAVVLIGVHHPGQRGLDAGEKGGEHGADEQDIEYIVVRFLKEIAVDNGGHNAHQDHIRREGQVRAAGQKAARAGEKDHRRVNQGVEGVHTQQAGGDDGIVDDGLEHDGGAADGKGGDEHDYQLGGADFHGVEHQLLAAEVDRHNHVAHRGQQNQQGQQSHLADVCPVGGGGKGCACPVHAASPPSRWAAGAQPQPAPPPVRRIALRPWRSR